MSGNGSDAAPAEVAFADSTGTASTGRLSTSGSRRRLTHRGIVLHSVDRSASLSQFVQRVASFFHLLFRSLSLSSCFYYLSMS